MSQISQTYAFLPREAVTKFLMSCSDCQKRMHLTMDLAPGHQSGLSREASGMSPDCPEADRELQRSGADAQETENLPMSDFNVPITVSYLNFLKQKKVST